PARRGYGPAPGLHRAVKRGPDPLRDRPGGLGPPQTAPGPSPCYERPTDGSPPGGAGLGGRARACLRERRSRSGNLHRSRVRLPGDLPARRADAVAGLLGAVAAGTTACPAPLPGGLVPPGSPHEPEAAGAGDWPGTSAHLACPRPRPHDEQSRVTLNLA